MTVISLAEAREKLSPHLAGTRVCLGCGHEWVGVTPVGVVECLECPSCNLPKGVTKHLIGAPKGAHVLVCTCGCECLTSYKSAGHFYVKCMACGTDLTHAFYEG